MIAGDGYAYIPYSYGVGNGGSENSGCGCGCTNSWAGTQYLRLLRIGPTGDSYEIALGEYSSGGSSTSFSDSPVYSWGSSYSATPTLPTLITNADQGVLASYSVTNASTNASSSGTSSSSYTTSYYLATTAGPSLASNSQVAMVLEQTSPVQPILQRADGSYVGTVSSSVGNFMVAFTASGNTLFTVPNDTPQIATAGGGVIGTSGTTYDQNGNVTGQIASMPTQSWTGNSYQLGSIDQVAETPLIAASLWSWQGGNPGGTGTAGRPWYFRLTWQNDFTFTPDYPINIPNLTTEINQWATTVKQLALQEVQDAYSGVPVTVFEGQSGGDSIVTIVNRVPGVEVCGDTNPNNPVQHQVDYVSNMQEAQAALQVTISNPQAEQAVLADDTGLFQAIGRGIGTSAAHEIAHQFLLGCCDMDANPQTDPNARGTFNATGCNGQADPSPWTGYWPSPKIDLHWEAPALNALGQCLGKGWANFNGKSCHN